jgi:hypothetical protein
LAGAVAQAAWNAQTWPGLDDRVAVAPPITWPVDGGESGEIQMRSFILACIAVAVIASASAEVLRHFQVSAEQAFSTKAVRL